MKDIWVTDDGFITGGSGPLGIIAEIMNNDKARKDALEIVKCIKTVKALTIERDNLNQMVSDLQQELNDRDAAEDGQ